MRVDNATFLERLPQLFEECLESGSVYLTFKQCRCGTAGCARCAARTADCSRPRVCLRRVCRSSVGQAPAGGERRSVVRLLFRWRLRSVCSVHVPSPLCCPLCSPVVHRTCRSQEDELVNSGAPVCLCVCKYYPPRPDVCSCAPCRSPPKTSPSSTATTSGL